MATYRIPPRYGLFLVICLLWTAGRAQDALFKQLGATPLLTNPALTGVMDGQLRLQLNYQELYTRLTTDEAYRSVAAAVDIRRPVNRGNFAGFGLLIQHDQAGSSDYVRSQGLLSASYQQQLAGYGRGKRNAHYLSGGAQLGVGQRGFDLNKVWFSEQYFVDPASRQAYLDRSLPSKEAFSGMSGDVYVDMNAGLAWFASLGDRRSAYFGGATYHLNEPNVSPLPESQDVLYRRYVIHGGGEIPLGAHFSTFLPSFRWSSQGPSQTLLLGGSLRYTQREWREIALRLGSYGQLAAQEGSGSGLSSLIVLAALEMERVQIGVSYDLRTGDLNPVTNSRGGFEISIAYRQEAAYPSRVRCPTF
ncbi:type IX secretion system PorP/SprF family membrane protein [Neolewinella xylanilytica]|uniref:Type IX secretion system PorP/SprF family membrane protein n=1 Tax=Neolewinella xylanilytica TaxID=1514080 RepID=A0A2S6I5L6_9BACT|nr:PorP/SprF family type IX secretion system membrane protein [Neolewinella xylanilytica]PPK86458.1 type IX secretion system PorP/SprF family membrane protein [Neolewinella xylanilytica]